MQENLESANRLNSQGIFQDIYYTPCAGFLPQKLQKNYFKIVKDALDGFAHIRENYNYNQYLSKSIGYDFFKGFKNLRESTLILDTQIGGSHFEEAEDIDYDKDKNAFLFQILVNDYSLINRNPGTSLTSISHELGHTLVDASLHSASEIRDGMKIIHYPEDRSYQENWHMELSVDKVAVASNLENNLCTTLAESGKGNWLNKAYEKGWIGKNCSEILSEFCEARDGFLMKQSLLYATDLASPLNRIFNMRCSTTHPASIRRAVESENFAAKAAGFLKNQR